MDIQAYRVAVRIALDDQISRQMMQVSRDALELNKTFVQMARNINTVTSAANKAATAFGRMNSAMKNQFSGATRDANGYATAMRSVTEQAGRAQTALKSLPVPASSGGLPYLALGTAAGLTSSGGGNYGGGNNGIMGLPSPKGGGWNGWKNGVPPGGWGGSGQPPAGSGSGQNAYPGGGSHSNGMTNLATGYFGFEFLKGAVEVGAEYQTTLAKFTSYGMGDAAVKEADKFAQATKIMGASKNDMLRYFTEAQGVFRESGALTLDEQLKGARLAAPMLAKMHFAMSSMDPAANHMSQSKEMDMLRFVEQAGGLNSPVKFNSIMNNAYKAVQASGGNIDFSQLRQFMSRAGTSAYNLSDTALYAKLEPIIGEMKGGAAGDALMTSYNRLTGTIKLPNQVVKQLEDMGVWDKSKVIHNSQGGIKSIIGGPGSQLKDMKLLANDPVAFYENVIRPKYAAMGMSEEKIQLQNNVIFGRQGGKMFNLIEKQMHVIELAAQAFETQMNIDNASKQTAGTYNGKAIDFDAKWKDFQLALSKDGGLLDIFTKGLNALSTTLQKMTDIAHKYPDLAKFVGQAALAVTGLAALSGGFWVLKHAVGGLITPLKLVGWGLNALLGVNGAAGFPALATALGGLPALITGILVAVTAYSAYEVYQWYKDGMSKDPTFQAGASEASKGASRFNVTNPNALDDYRHLLNPNKYPKVPPKPTTTQEQPVNLLMTDQGRKVIVATVISGMTKQATKAPSGPSAFDSSNLMTYPGQVSAVSTN